METLQLIIALENVPAEFRPVSFWFMNHYLQPEEMRRQIREMANKGYGGFMFHGRDGLRSRYLEQEWEDALRVAMDEAKKQGLDAWLYDENHYPSGIAGGKILEQLPGRSMRSLAVSAEERVSPGATVRLELEQAPRYAFAVPTSTPTAEPIELLSRITGERLEWQNPFSSDAVVLVLVEHAYQPGPGNLYESYPDYLDPEVAGGFIQQTHGWYRERFGRDLGAHFRGIFTDNACANFGHIRRSIPWSHEFDRRFLAAAGTRIEPLLPWLFLTGPAARESRLRFWRFLGDEFIRTFIGAIRTVCDDAHIFSTGHYCLEDGMGEHIRQIGDYFAVMKNQSLNAVDQLGPALKGGSLFDYPPGKAGTESVTACIRNTASAALFYDSPRVMCESFGLASGWRLDLGEIRRIVGFLSALGADLFVPHGLYYSIAGNRKWECTPDHLHNPLWDYSRAWTDWAGRISFLTAGWESVAEVAVLHPTTTLQAHIELGAPKTNPDATDLGPVADRVEATFRDLVNELLHSQVVHEILPEDVLQQAVVTESVLCVPTRKGKSTCTLRCVILPAVRVIELRTLDILRQFAQSGGKVLCLGDLPDAAYDPATGTLTGLDASALPFEVLEFSDATATAPPELWQRLGARLRAVVPQPLEIRNSRRQIISRVWEKWGRRFYLLHNCSTKAQRNLSMTIRDSQSLSCLDLEQAIPTATAVAGVDGRFRLDLEAAETLVFVEDSATSALPYLEAPEVCVSLPEQAISIGGPWSFTTKKPNILPLRNGRMQYAECKERHEFPFRAGELPAPVWLLVDHEMTRSELICQRYSNRLKVWVNDQLAGPFQPGAILDHWIFETDVAALLRSGVNRIVIETGGIFLENDHRLWNPYLAGDFTLSSGRAQPVLASQLDLGDWTRMGFPYFAGEGIYRKTLRLPDWGNPQTCVLDLGKLANTAAVFINGQPLGVRVNPPWRFTLPELAGGTEVQLEVRVINTPENLFGPKPLPSGLFGPVQLFW